MPIPYRVEPDIAGLVHEQINDAVRQSGRRPVVTMECRAVHRYQIEARVEGHRFLTDEPIHGGGTDVAPAPLRYFVAGVLQCSMIWCIKVAAVDGVSITELSATAEAYLEAGTVGPGALSATETIASGRGFDRILLAVTMETDDATSAETAVAVVRKGIRACPAAVAFSRGATLDFTLLHNGREVS